MNPHNLLHHYVTGAIERGTATPITEIPAMPTNIDTTTGIRYGVISLGDIAQVWSDESEPEYGPPTCPQCGNEAADYVRSLEYVILSEPDYACDHCRVAFSNEYAFPDEPLGYYVNTAEYEAHDCLDSDVMVTRSPYYTHAALCSPCVPNAGNLNAPTAKGVRTYCFEHDWFESGTAPYPVYSVKTGQLVQV